MKLKTIIKKLGAGPPDWATPDAIHSKCGEQGGQEAVRAIDMNTGTEWRHQVVSNHWIIFDMGETKSVTKIRLFQSSGVNMWGFTSGVIVYVSDNPEDWGDAVWEGTLNAIENDWNESGTFEKSGRYIKLYCKYNGNTQDMYEFEAYVPT